MSLRRGLSDPVCQNVQIKIQPAINDFYSSAHMNTIFLVIFQTTGPRAGGQSFYLQGSDKRRGAGPVIFWLNRQIGSRDTDEDTHAGHKRCLFVFICCCFVFCLFLNMVSLFLPNIYGPMQGAEFVLSFVVYFFFLFGCC